MSSVGFSGLSSLIPEAADAQSGGVLEVNQREWRVSQWKM